MCVFSLDVVHCFDKFRHIYNIPETGSVCPCSGNVRVGVGIHQHRLACFFLTIRHHRLGWHLSLLAHFLHFEKKIIIKLCLWDLHAVCVSVYPHKYFSVLEPIFYETRYVYRGTSAHLNGVIHKSFPLVCLCSHPTLLGNGSVKTFPRQWIHTQQHNCLTRRFLCGPCGAKESRRWVIQRNSCFLSTYRRERVKLWIIVYCLL
jgi:hypothetical protein